VSLDHHSVHHEREEHRDGHCGHKSHAPLAEDLRCQDRRQQEKGRGRPDVPDHLDTIGLGLRPPARSEVSCIDCSTKMIGIFVEPCAAGHLTWRFVWAFRELAQNGDRANPVGNDGEWPVFGRTVL